MAWYVLETALVFLVDSKNDNFYGQTSLGRQKAVDAYTVLDVDLAEKT